VNKKGGKSPELGERAEASRLWLTSPRLFAGRQELDRWWRGRGRPTVSGHASSLCVETWRRGRRPSSPQVVVGCGSHPAACARVGRLGGLHVSPSTSRSVGGPVHGVAS
jgi:hypothetical protein